jgi:hypothetical protein
MGVATHLIGALVVTIVMLLLGVLVTQQFPDDCTLAPAAEPLMGITFVPVMLGTGAFLTVGWPRKPHRRWAFRVWPMSPWVPPP